MEQHNTASQESARIVVDIVFSNPERIQVTVTQTCGKHIVNQVIEAALSGIVLRWPNAVIRRVRSEASMPSVSTHRGRRGGPIGTPEDQKIKIARAWLRLQGRVNQESYAQSQGIAASTLRRWINQLRQARKL